MAVRRNIFIPQIPAMVVGFARKYAPQTLLRLLTINLYGRKINAFSALPVCIVVRKKRYSIKSEQKKGTGI
jgi:hypothetical protein